jgi:hypothetical protein
MSIPEKFKDEKLFISSLSDAFKITGYLFPETITVRSEHSMNCTKNEPQTTRP